MKIHTLTVAMLRLSALVLLYFIFLHTSQLIYSINFADWSTMLMTTFTLSFLIFTAVLFWFYPVQFSHKLFQHTDSSSTSTVNTIQLLHTGVILLGLTVFVWALIELAQWFIYYSIMNTPPDVNKFQLIKVGLFNILSRLTIGILLLTKSYWLTVFLLKLNSPEHSNQQDD